MAVVQIANDFITSEEWQYSKLPCVKFGKILHSSYRDMAKKAKVSKVKVTR